MTEASGKQSALDKTMEKIFKLSDEHRYETQWQLIKETLPKAKADRSLYTYIHLLFLTANSCNSSLNPLRQRDASVELITLLESFDAAQRIQPDLSEDLFEELKHWYSSCAYDNLALATANIEGFNSEGMFEAINQGIEKCRQTGKTQCITCFREYAVSVSLAADDLELAAKQAQQLALRAKDSAQYDRRAVSWKELGRIQILAGDLESSLQSFDQALTVAGEYHDPRFIELAVHRYYELVYALLDRPEQYQEFAKKHPCPESPQRGESRVHDILTDHVKAVKACLAGDFDAAIEIRKEWIQWAEETQNLAEWFELQVCLIATLKLKDSQQDVSKLIEKTRDKATEKRDWLTLKRLSCLEDPEFTVNPLGTVAPFIAGRYSAPVEAPGKADKDVKELVKVEEAGEEESSPKSEPDFTPMMTLFQETAAKLQSSGNQQGLIQELVVELLDTRPQSLEDERDAAYYLRMLAWAFQLGLEVPALWKKAKLVAKSYSKDPTVSGLFADLADAYRNLEGEAERPTVEEVDKLYQAALSLDIGQVQSYFNAGVFYKSIDRLSEAERCFARASRLDRSWGPAALALAEIYLQSERPSDAVEVLDLAIRHGCKDPNIVWQAGLGAFRLEMWLRAVSYFQLFRQLVDNQPFTQYYTALALCQLEKYQEAIDAIDIEVKINPGLAFAAHSIKSLSFAKLGKNQEAELEIDACLNYRFASVKGLNASGLSKAIERVRQAASTLNDQRRGDMIVERALRAGVISSDFFEEQRALNKTREEVELRLFEVTVKQALPEEWKDDSDCPRWEANWESYLVNWLVLAPSLEQAEAMAMAYQKTCGTLDPELIETKRLEDDAVLGQEWGIIDLGPRDPKLKA